MASETNNITIRITSGTIVKGVLIIISFILLYILRDIALIVLTSIVIASAVEPAVKKLHKYKVPRLIAVIFVYLFIITILATVVYFLMPTLLTETSGFISSINSIDLGAALRNRGILPSGFLISQNFSVSDLLNSLQMAFSGFTQGFVSIVSIIFGGVLSFIVVLVLSFYFTVQDDGVGELLKVVVPVKHQAYIVDLWRRSQRKIGRWLQGQILLGVIVGVLDYLGLTILGIQHALLLAVIAAIFEIIPLFGPILSAIPGILIGYSTGGVTLAFLAAGLYTIVQQFESNLIYPVVVNKVIGVSPVLVIVALLVGAHLAGFIGAILSIPIAAVVMEYYNDLKKNRVAAELVPK